jgi:hypothetical protein
MNFCSVLRDLERFLSKNLIEVKFFEN